MCVCVCSICATTHTHSLTGSNAICVKRTQCAAYDAARGTAQNNMPIEFKYVFVIIFIAIGPARTGARAHGFRAWMDLLPVDYNILAN